MKAVARQEPERKYEFKAKLFKVFSDPTRLRILEHLKNGETNVTSLCDALNLKQSTVSQHLRMLKECGAVVAKKKGREIFYTIRDPRVVEMLELGEDLLVLTIEDMMSCVCE
jgi:DNA-binding transcriptional ArsR family regulator